MEGHLRLNGEEVVKAFEPLREVLQRSSAVIYDGWKRVGYGVVISPDGYIVTKASELEGIEELSVRVDRKQFDNVKVLASTVEWDVALLRVEADDLVPVDWEETVEPGHGTWVVSNGASSRLRRRVRVGIISANAREVGGGQVPVVLGVELKIESEALAIKAVQDDSGAAEAGLQADDVILTADGTAVANIEELKAVLEGRQPGDKLKLRIKRGEEEMDKEVELRAREDIFEEKKTRNDQMSGRYSERRTNFPRVLQHDVPFSERGVGGPLLNLDGRCVGMNIARVNRCESYAIPAAEMLKLIQELFAKVD